MSKKTKEIREMSKEARASRIEELTLELAKARATSQKSSGKTIKICGQKYLKSSLKN
jgi:ribosomal protein L29